MNLRRKKDERDAFQLDLVLFQNRFETDSIVDRQVGGTQDQEWLFFGGTQIRKSIKKITLPCNPMPALCIYWRRQFPRTLFHNVSTTQPF
jgi:hypothetical protein